MGLRSASTDRARRKVSGLTRAIAVLTVIASMMTVGLAGIIVGASPAAAQTCSGDTWTNTAGGAWETGTNWSTGSAPTSGQVACITTAGTYTVTMGNDTLTVGGLVLGGTGVAATLSIGNNGSGEPDLTFGSVDVATGSGLNFNFGGSFNVTGTLTNSGSINTAEGGLTTSFTVATTDNEGVFAATVNLTYNLPSSSSTFNNETGGTIALGTETGSEMTFQSPSDDLGTVNQEGGTISTSGTLTVLDNLSVSGGQICGDPIYVGQNEGSVGGLSFASNASTGTSCGHGITSNEIAFNNATATLTGNIPKGYTVEEGNAGSGFADVTVNGNVTNSGTFDPGWGSTTTATGTFTNKGTVDVPATGFETVLDFTDFVNQKAFKVNGVLTINEPSTGLVQNKSTGTITVASGVTVDISNPSPNSGSVLQDGVIDNSGTINLEVPLTIDGGSICGNEIRVGEDGGQSESISFATTVPAGPACATGDSTNNIFMANITGTLNGNVPKGYTLIIGDGGSSYAHVSTSGTTNAGTLEPQYGATLTFSSTFTNTGTIDVPANGYTTEIVVGGNMINSGKITTDATFEISLPAGDSLTTSKKIKVAGSGERLAVTGSVDNTGQIQIGASDLFTVSGTYTQSSTGKFKPTLGSSSSIGRLDVTGTASLAGTVAAKLASGYQPTSGTTWVVLESGGLGGSTFGTVSGSYTAQYLSSDEYVQLTYS